MMCTPTHSNPQCSGSAATKAIAPTATTSSSVVTDRPGTPSAGREDGEEGSTRSIWTAGRGTPQAAATTAKSAAATRA